MTVEIAQYPRWRINPHDAHEIQLQITADAPWEGFEFHPTTKQAARICDRLNLRPAAPLFDTEETK